MTDRKEKFTPGPWKWKIFGKDQKCFMIFNGVLDALASLYFHGNKTTSANAALIAAAPEMYEALKNLMCAMDDVVANGANIPDCIMYVVGEAQEKAEMAMKKARGEE